MVSNYVKKVYDAYEQGAGEKGYKLWGITLLIVAGLGAAYFSLYTALTLSDKWAAETVVVQSMIANETANTWPAPKEISIKRILADSEQDKRALKKRILALYSPEELEQIEGIEAAHYDQSTFLAIIESEKDWWEELKVGKMENGVISWLEIKDPPTESSILAARFVELKGMSDPVLEAFGQTHMGNGHMYLYTIKNREAIALFDAPAVDFHNEDVWQPEGYPQYGYSSCGEVYKSGQLNARYDDLNEDGVSDVVLTGTTEVLCEKIKKFEPYVESETVKVAETPVRLTYFLKPY